MVLSIPVRLADGVGNVPAAANWNDDYDWLTSLLLGLGFIANGGMEAWAAGTTFTNPANGATLADNWTEVKSGTSACTADVTREATTIDSGTYSMKVNITGAGSSDSIWGIKQSAGTPSAFGTQTLLAGVKVLCSTASKVRIKVYDGTTTAYSSYHTGGGTWELLQAKLTCATTPSEITATIEINPSNFTGAVYIDSAYLYVVPAAISTRGQQALIYTPLSTAGSFLPLTGGTLTGTLKIADGAVGAPGLGFASEPTTGIYRSGAGFLDIANLGVKTAEFRATGTTNATTYSPFYVYGGPSNKLRTFDIQNTTGVSTATTIYSLPADAALVLVYGKQTVGGTTEFFDVVACGYNATVTTLASISVSGSSAARTYSMSAANLRVAMASNTYTITAYGMGIQG